MAQGGLAETGKVKRRAWRHVFVSSCLRKLRLNQGGTRPAAHDYYLRRAARAGEERHPTTPPADHNGKVLTARNSHESDF